MTEKKSKHIHKLKRLKYKSGSVIFFCALPDCSFKINISLALGKRSICWRCGDTFIMTEYALRLAKPHCEKCHHPKKDGPIDEIIDNASTGPMVFEKFMKDITLADRLNEAIQNAKQQEEEEI